jgi:hypothetical protein
MAERRGFGPEAPAPADLKHGHDQQLDSGNHVFNWSVVSSYMAAGSSRAAQMPIDKTLISVQKID